MLTPNHDRASDPPSEYQPSEGMYITCAKVVRVRDECNHSPNPPLPIVQNAIGKRRLCLLVREMHKDDEDFAEPPIMTVPSKAARVMMQHRTRRI